VAVAAGRGRRTVKRTFTLSIALLLLLAVVAAAAAATAQFPRKSGPPAVARALLDVYVAQTFPGSEVSLHAIERAPRPENLRQALAGPSFGDSVHFQTDRGPSSANAGDRAPLPFPPREAWCVLLTEPATRGEAPTRTIVLLALHVDLYNADWVVHQAPPGSHGSEMLSKVGCRIEWQRWMWSEPAPRGQKRIDDRQRG
jgi:hypothetical protein